MNVLVINCGSSSLKYQVIHAESEEVLAKGLCERIGIDGRLVYQPKGAEKEITEASMPTHTEAVRMVLDALVNPDTGVLKSLDEIDAVGHRVVHGGEKFANSTLITDEVIEAVEECSDLAPLHNPANLIGVRACQEVLKGVPMVAVFDTAFHQTMPKEAYLYGVPYVSKRAAEMLGKPYDSLKTIVCHLGNGASICAVKNGKSVDTSMGLSPLEGLIMGTRSGDIDPSAVEFLAKKENLDLEGIVKVLNKESGVYGLSGVSSDFRDLDQASVDGNERAKAAVDAFCYRTAKYIGSYAAAMNGVDVICFTAGVGENDGKVRAKVLSYLGYLGITLDEEANQARGKEVRLSTADSKVTVLLVPTNEELAICRETVSIIK